MSPPRRGAKSATALPAWVSAEIGDFPELREFYELQKVFDATKRGDLDLAAFWTSIDKFENGIRHRSANRRSVLLPLAQNLRAAVRGFAGGARLSKKERVAAAAKIGRLARSLSTGIDALGSDPTWWLDGPDYKSQLDAIMHAAARWAEFEPSVAKPKLKGADRTYFLRVMSTYFFARYGHPLHEDNIRLSQLFFPKYQPITADLVAHVTEMARGAVRAARARATGPRDRNSLRRLLDAHDAD